jgi:hypothetical protein
MLLIYEGWLPKISNKIVHPLARHRLKQRATKVFGVLPPCCYPTRHASVRIVRVLGPRQKPMDSDNLSILVAGLRDALKPCYIKDDSPKWGTFDYVNDGTRRDVGPRIEVTICYEGMG